MRRWEASIAIGAAVFVAMAAPRTAGATVCPDAYALPSSAPLATLEEATLCLVNEQRALAGARPVGPQRDLYAAARRHALDMEARGYFGHRSPEGEGVLERVMQRQYLHGWNDWDLAENLCWGVRSEATPAATVGRWLLSPGHRRSMLDPSFREAGLAIVPGAPLPGITDVDAASYVLDLGTRSSPVKASQHKRKRHRKRRRTRRARTEVVARTVVNGAPQPRATRPAAG